MANTTFLARLTQPSAWSIALLRIILIFFNFSFLMTGAAMLFIGIWMLTGGHSYFAVDSSDSFSVISIVLISVGLFIAIVGIASCCCISSKSSCLLYMYSIFVGVCLVSEIGVGITSMVYRNSLEDSFREGLERNMRYYMHNARSEEIIDLLQNTLQCCGSENYMDWRNIFAVPVPQSCCMNHRNCDTSDPININQIGCYTAVTSFMNASAHLIGIGCLGLACFHCLGLGVACLLASCLVKWDYQPIP